MNTYQLVQMPSNRPGDRSKYMFQLSTRTPCGSTYVLGHIMGPDTPNPVLLLEPNINVTLPDGTQFTTQPALSLEGMRSILETMDALRQPKGVDHG
jgi:hypothetical protein